MAPSSSGASISAPEACDVEQVALVLIEGLDGCRGVVDLDDEAWSSRQRLLRHVAGRR